jgi:hypothetical protein
MTSASCYTNKMRVGAIARDVRVQQPNGQAIVVRPFNAVSGCNLDYTTYIFTKLNCNPSKFKPCK